MQPNFICIGTFRAGTTWLYKVLLHHPDVFLPKEKELMFFTRHYDKGIKWYKNFYDGYSGEKIVGDISPSYLSYGEAPNRMHKHIPDAKIIVSLRNPADQIWSLYNLWLNRGYTKKSLNTVIHEKEELLNNVLYFKHIQRFMEYYSKDNILIIFYEDLKRSPISFLEKIYRFLEIEEIYADEFFIAQNKTRKPKNLAIERLIVGGGDLLRRSGLVNIKALLSQTGIISAIKYLNTANTTTNNIPPEIKSFIESYVAEDRDKLSQILEKDLSFWK